MLMLINDGGGEVVHIMELLRNVFFYRVIITKPFKVVYFLNQSSIGVCN